MKNTVSEVKRKNILDKILPKDIFGSYFRLVETEDAEFIVSLRTNPKLARFLSPTSNDINAQVAWLKKYKLREEKGEEFYIICLDQDKKTKQGLSRIYNINDNNYEIGSWLFSNTAKQGRAILCDLFTRSIAFEQFNMEKCVFEVRKENKSVLRYHEKFNPKKVREDDLNYYYELDYNNFVVQRDKLLKTLKYD